MKSGSGTGCAASAPGRPHDPPASRRASRRDGGGGLSERGPTRVKARHPLTTDPRSRAALQGRGEDKRVVRSSGRTSLEPAPPIRAITTAIRPADDGLYLEARYVWPVGAGTPCAGSSVTVNRFTRGAAASGATRRLPLPSASTPKTPVGSGRVPTIAHNS